MRQTFWFTSALAALVAAACCWPAAAADEPADDAAEIQQTARLHLAKTKLTIEEAIAIALKKHAGGHAIEAAFEVEEEDYDFIVEVAVGNKLFDVEVDAVGGKIESNEPVTDATPEEKATAAAVAKGKVPLTKAVAAALESVGVKGAKAFGAGPRLIDGKLIYEVGILADKDIYAVRVDGTTGKATEKKKVE